MQRNFLIHYFGLLAIFILFHGLRSNSQPSVNFQKNKSIVETEKNATYQELKDELKSYDQNLESDTLVNALKPPLGIQKGLSSSISYTLISPSFDSEKLRTQNQESLGLTVSAGYLYAPVTGWGISLGLGIFQNAKTDRSLPDFVALRPYTQLIYGLNQQFFISGGIYTLKWQDERFKNYISYIGSETHFGYKASTKISLRFGFNFIKLYGEFFVNDSLVTSLVSIRGLESQILYVF